MRFFYNVMIVLTLASFCFLLGFLVKGKTKEPVPAVALPPIPPVVQLPPLGDASVPVQGYVPLEPVVPADLYVDRMRALRRACPAKFAVIAVREGVFGECWDYQADKRIWAEWIAQRPVGP